MTDSAPDSRAWRIVHSEASCGWGGQEHRVMAELSGFQQRGSAVWVMAEEHSQILKRAADAGMGTVPIRFKRSRLLLDAVRLAFWLRRERIDVLNTHSSRDGWLLGIAGRLARVPLLIRSRHIDVEYPNVSVSRHAFTTFADHVLTTSQKITDHFQRIFRIPSEHITTLPTGIDVERFRPEGAKADLPVLKDANSAPVVGMVSVLRSWKGHPIFFEAASILRESGRRIQFVVVGGGAPVERFQAMAIEKGAGASVQFTGHREDVAEILRSLDLLVIPSTRHEGVPQIGLQALATQTPVIGSDCGGIPEIIQDGVTGRIAPAGDAAALAARIAEALDQREATLEMARRGRELVVRKYSLSAMIDQLDALYRRYIP